MMYAYLIHLSRHLWDDSTSLARGLYLSPDYTENNNTDLATWDEVIQGLARYGFNTVVIDVCDALQYESHPEISAPDAWSKEFLKKKLDEIRALGMEPIPKLNFSAAHDIWLKDYSRMISTPTYYQVCADLIREVCEVFDHPRYLHLGMDEESDHYQRYYDISIVRHETLWWHDLHFLFEECRKNGARPWLWSSFSLNTYPERFSEQMPKTVLQTLGTNGKYYGLDAVTPAEKRQSTEKLLDNIDRLHREGYDLTLLCSNWGYYRNILQTAALAKDRLDPALFKGFIVAPWLPTRKTERLALLSAAEKMWYARQDFFPETL
ncbi:MAG: hypothetical protein IJP27_08320 [Clostridia bacterium]|nr:hypothetical protein [Clostridia bacterium]